MLGVGIYCLYEWADGERPAVVERVKQRDPATGQEVAAAARVIRPADNQGGWPYLASGLALVALSFGGFIPISLMLGNPGRLLPDDPRGEPQWIDRPDGSQLFIESYGPDKVPTLIFTHGWTLDSSAWHYVKKELAGRFRCVVWDLPGLGRSKAARDGDQRIEKMAADLATVVETAGSGPIVLVGHSIGGMICQTFCRLYPQLLKRRIAGLVLIHTTYTNPLNTALGAGLWKAIEKPVIVPLNQLMIWLAPLAWLSNWQGYLNGSTHLWTRIASFAGSQTWGELQHGAWLGAKAWPAVIARGNFAMLEFDERKTLREIELPVLVIAADYDRLTRPVASEHIDQFLPAGALASVPAGHLACWERHEEVNSLIAEFAERFRSVPAAEDGASSRTGAHAEHPKVP
jgi:pimeloyl-ACP methyl ester carboxylesterase